MPYKSEAQRRLFHWLAAQGKMPKAKVREYDIESRGKKLPEFVGHEKKAFGGQIEGKRGVRCPACDYPLDQIPVALDAGEACPRCGYGDAKDVPHKARGGEIDAYVDELGPRYRKVSEGMERYKPREKINQFSAQRARSATDLPGLSQEAKDILAGKARGGEMMDVTAYRARGGAISNYADGGVVAKQSARDREYFDKLMQIKDKHEKKWYDVYPQMLKAGAQEADVDAARRRIQAQEDRESESLLRQYPEQRGKQRRDEQLSQIKKDLATRGAIEGEMGPPAPPMTYAHGGAVCSKCGHNHKMARGGDVMHCARCGSMMAMGGYVPLKAYGGEIGLEGNMKELYPSRGERGADLDDGKIRRFGKMFAQAIKYRRG